MRYTSWDRSDPRAPILREEDGVRDLAVFTESTATVGGEQWALDVDPKSGASMTLPDGREFRARGNLKRGSLVEATVAERSFHLVGETSKDWVIEDADGEKVGQFTGAHRGVRRAIVEFDGEGEPTEEEAIALSWFARLILDAKQTNAGIALIVTMLLLTLVAVLVWIL